MTSCKLALARIAAVLLAPLLLLQQHSGFAAGQGLDVTLGQLGAGALATAAQFDLFEGGYTARGCTLPQSLQKRERQTTEAGGFQHSWASCGQSNLLRHELVALFCCCVMRRCADSGGQQHWW